MLVMQPDPPYVAPFIRKLMPHATEQEIVEASENLRAYLKLAFEAFLRNRQATHQRDSRDMPDHDRFAEGGVPPSI